MAIWFEAQEMTLFATQSEGMYKCTSVFQVSTIDRFLPPLAFTAQPRLSNPPLPTVCRLDTAGMRVSWLVSGLAACTQNMEQTLPRPDQVFLYTCAK